jgi:hypothetical protein
LHSLDVLDEAGHTVGVRRVDMSSLRSV